MMTRSLGFLAASALVLLLISGCPDQPETTCTVPHGAYTAKFTQTSGSGSCAGLIGGVVGLGQYSPTTAASSISPRGRWPSKPPPWATSFRRREIFVPPIPRTPIRRTGYSRSANTARCRRTAISHGAHARARTADRRGDPRLTVWMQALPARRASPAMQSPRALRAPPMMPATQPWPALGACPVIRARSAFRIRRAARAFHRPTCNTSGRTCACT